MRSLLCSILFPLASFAADVDVGGTTIKIPAPEGYTQVTSSMQPYWDLTQRMVPPSNEEVAQFIPHGDLPEVQKGGMPESGRRAYVQVIKTTRDRFVTKENFVELKDTMKRENDEILKKAQKEMPAIAEKISRGIAKDYEKDVSLSFNQMVPYPPHEDTDRTFAYSLLINMSVGQGKDSATTSEGIVTASMVHTKGKILCMYITGDKEKLDETRTQASAWAKQVIALNPSTGDIASREDKKSGFDWNRVLIGAGIGAGVGLISTLFRKKPKPAV